MKNFLESLLTFESDKKVLGFRFQFENTLIWPMIRHFVFQESINVKLDFSPAHSRTGRPSLKKYLKYVIQCWKYRPSGFRNKAEILIFSTSRLNNSLKQEKYFNYLHDDFAGEYPENTLILEDSFQRSFSFPRYFPLTASHDSLRLKAILHSKLFDPDPKDVQQINALIQYLKQEFPFQLPEKSYRTIVKRLTDLSVRLYILKPIYLRLFKAKKTKLIFLNTASYGYESYITKWARECGIHTAEIQHGTISHSHPAYRFSPAIIKDKEFSEYFPDDLLTFGDYWNTRVRGPFKPYTLGIPHFWEQENNTLSQNENRVNKKEILIVSQGTVTEFLVDFTLKLADLLKDTDLNIHYRLHPGEVAFTERYQALNTKSNIRVSHTGNFSHVLNNAQYIVGIYSTALFEAVAAGKKMFIINHPGSIMHIDKDLGIWINSAQELKGYLTSRKRSRENAAKPEALFGKLALKRYKQYIKKVLDQ